MPMTNRMTTGDTTRRLELLDEAIRTVQGMVVHASEGVLGWIAAIASHIASVGDSILILLRNQKSSGCKLLARSMYDGFIDILYIGHDRSKDDEHMDLFMVEYIHDMYDAVNFDANRRNQTLEQAASQDAVVRLVVDDYERIPEILGRRKRWRTIGFEDKLKVVQSDLTRALGQLRFSIRDLGHGQAHSRPSELSRFLRFDNSTMTVAATPDDDTFLFSVDLIAFEAYVCLLVVANQLIDLLSLGSEWQQRVRKLHDEGRELSSR